MVAASRLMVQAVDQKTQSIGAFSPEAKDPAVTDLTAHGLRAWGLMTVRLTRLSKRPPTVALQAILAIAFSCLRRNYRPAPIVIDQAVTAARALAGPQAARYVNAILRRTTADPAASAQDEWHLVSLANAPAWLVHRLLQAGVQTLIAYCKTALLPPPFVLRYLGSAQESGSWHRALTALGHSAFWSTERAVILEPPAPVDKLPGFREGHFRVQDSSAQQAYGLLPLCPGQQVLDACAAPGGKTLLIAEQAPVEIWAIDQSAHRLQRLVLEWDRVAHQFPGRRLHTVVADLAQDRWPDGLLPMFDHIVLDAPCSGTGVVRRHPEIPWSRSQASIYKLGAIQARLLKRLWRALRPGGQMLYITCSVLPEEGEAQISRFLDETPDATRLSAPGQILPYYDATETQRSAGDGFFYARLQKCLGGSRRPDDRSSEPLAGSR